MRVSGQFRRLGLVLNNNEQFLTNNFFKGVAVMYKSIFSVVGVVAVVAAFCVGCGDGDKGTASDNTGGGSSGLVGDWLIVSQELDGEDSPLSKGNEKSFFSLKSSGDFVSTQFVKVTDFWIEILGSNKYSIKGDTIFVTESGGTALIKYKISGDTLNFTILNINVRMTAIRDNLANTKKSLGKVYSQDAALTIRSSWVKPSASGDGNSAIEFWTFFDDFSNIYINRNNYYDVLWYTEGSQVTLLGLNCGVEEISVLSKCVSYSIAETVTLDYQVTNGTLSLRPTGSSDWDVWTPYKNDGMYKSNVTPNTTKTSAPLAHLGLYGGRFLR